MLFFIRRKCPSHLNLSLIIALESRIEPHFPYSLLLEILLVSQVPKTIRRQFLRKTSSTSSSVLQSAHPSKPYFTTDSAAASEFRILVRAVFNIFIAPNVFTNNTNKVREAVHLINLFAAQRSLSIFTYS